jgi:hypothetical protein
MEESDLMASGKSLPLPKGWQRRVKSAVVQVVGMAHLALTHVRAKMTDDRLQGDRVKEGHDELQAP